jgi:hypothetical protein
MIWVASSPFIRGIKVSMKHSVPGLLFFNTFESGQSLITYEPISVKPQ